MKKIIQAKLLLLFFVCCLTVNVKTQAVDDLQVRDFIYASFENLVEVALRNKDEDASSDITAGFKKRVDLTSVSRFILGRHWRSVDKTTQKKFTSVVSDYLVDFFQVYFSLVFDVTHEKVRIKRISHDSNGKSVTVMSEIKDIRVDWQIAVNDQGKLLVRDVIVKDFSVLFALSNEVRKEIRSYGSVVALLKAKYKEPEVASDKKAREL